MILCIIILVRILRDRFHLEMGYLETNDWDIWYNLLTYNRRNIFSLQFLHKSAGNLEKSLFFFGFEVLSYIPLRRPYLAEILPIWRRTPSNQSINQAIKQSINQSINPIAFLATLLTEPYYQEVCCCFSKSKREKKNFSWKQYVL